MHYDLSQIKSLRRKLNLTQQQLAKKSGVSQSLIAKIEAKKIDPSYTSVKEIFLALEELRHKDALKAKDLMTKKIISCSSTDPIKKIVTQMKKYEISQLPVVDNNVVKGIITETNLLQAVTEHPDKNLDAKDVMEPAPPILQPDASDTVLSNLLAFYPLILIAEKGKLVGLVSKADFLRAHT